MEHTLDLGNTICYYANAVGKLMENYFSDIIKDVESIKEMTVGDVLYFIDLRKNNKNNLDKSEIFTNFAVSI